MIIGMVRSSTDASFTRTQLRSSIRRVDEDGLNARLEVFGRRIERYLTTIIVLNLYSLLLFQ